MERLTVPDEEIDGGTRRAVIDARAVREEAMKIYWALKKYEDTGLSPEEINSLNTLDGSQGMKYLKLYQEEKQNHCLIPVSERLPVGREFKIKAGDKTLYKKLIVQTCSFNIRTAHYDMAEQVWYDNENNELDVVAWMPTPELYHER